MTQQVAHSFRSSIIRVKLRESSRKETSLQNAENKSSVAGIQKESVSH
jgi:hypothetical protein